MLPRNYHTHTFRCNHASGIERDYIETAIKAGLKTLGFSDHTPYPFPETYYSGIRMKPSEQENYVKTLQELREEYKDRIEILIGYETEYYPRHFVDYTRMITRYEVDYLILGQHYLNNEYDGEAAGGATDSEDRLERTVNQVIEAMDTGLFSYIAHPDNLNFIGDKKIFDRQYTRLIEHAKDLNIPLEINFLGIRQGRHYPHEQFFELCGEIGAPVCFGCDAHEPESVNDTVSFETATGWVKKYKLNLVEKINLRKVTSL